MPDEKMGTESDTKVTSEGTQATDQGSTKTDGNVDTRPAASTDERTLEFQRILASVVGQKNEEIQRLQEQVDTIARRNEQEKTPPLTYEKFVESPGTVLGETVREAVREVVAPIIEEVRVLRGDRVFAGLRDEAIGLNPTLAQVFANPMLAEEIKATFATQNNKTAQTLSGVASLVVGNHILRGTLPIGNGGGNGNVASTREDKPKLENSPSIRSQSPAAPRVETKSGEVELNEAEAQAAKILGLTPAQYKNLTNASNGASDINSIRGALK